MKDSPTPSRVLSTATSSIPTSSTLSKTNTNTTAAALSAVIHVDTPNVSPIGKSSPVITSLRSEDNGDRAQIEERKKQLDSEVERLKERVQKRKKANMFLENEKKKKQEEEERRKYFQEKYSNKSQNSTPSAPATTTNTTSNTTITSTSVSTPPPKVNLNNNSNNIPKQSTQAGNIQVDKSTLNTAASETTEQITQAVAPSPTKSETSSTKQSSSAEVTALEEPVTNEKTKITPTTDPSKIKVGQTPAKDTTPINQTKTTTPTVPTTTTAASASPVSTPPAVVVAAVETSAIVSVRELKLREKQKFEDFAKQLQQQKAICPPHVKPIIMLSDDQMKQRLKSRGPKAMTVNYDGFMKQNCVNQLLMEANAKFMLMFRKSRDKNILKEWEGLEGEPYFVVNEDEQDEDEEEEEEEEEEDEDEEDEEEEWWENGRGKAEEDLEDEIEMDELKIAMLEEEIKRLREEELRQVEEDLERVVKEKEEREGKRSL